MNELRNILYILLIAELAIFGLIAILSQPEILLTFLVWIGVTIFAGLYTLWQLE